MYGGLYFTDADGNPFALRSAQGVEAWQMPGGNVEHGDASPFETAVRECREETGIAFEGSARLLLTHFLAPQNGWPCPKVGFVFDGGVLSEDVLERIVLDPSEHDAWRVHTLGEWRGVMGSRLYARLELLAAARSTGGAEFLCEA